MRYCTSTIAVVIYRGDDVAKGCLLIEQLTHNTNRCRSSPLFVPGCRPYLLRWKCNKKTNIQAHGHSIVGTRKFSENSWNRDWGILENKRAPLASSSKVRSRQKIWPLNIANMAAACIFNGHTKRPRETLLKKDPSSYFGIRDEQKGALQIWKKGKISGGLARNNTDFTIVFDCNIKQSSMIQGI